MHLLHTVRNKSISVGLERCFFFGWCGFFFFFFSHLFILIIHELVRRYLKLLPGLVVVSQV